MGKKGQIWDWGIQWEEPDNDGVYLVLLNEEARRQAGGFLIAASQDYPDATNIEFGILADFGKYEIDYRRQQLFAWVGQQLAAPQRFQLSYRNDPLDECQVQLSLDGGLTWSNAWRNDSCLPTAAAQNMNDYAAALAEGNQYITNITNIYNTNNLTTDLDPDAPDTDFDGSSGDAGPDADYRDAALCEACQQFVRVFLDGVLAGRNTTTGFLGALGTALLGIAVLLFPEVAIIAILAGAALGLFNTLDDATLSSPSKRRALACCMYNALKGVEITRENFAVSVNGCDEYNGIGISDVAGAIGGLLDDAGVFEVFVKALGQAYRYAAAGLLDTCPCDQTCYTYPDGDWTLNDGNIVTPGVVQYSATGFHITLELSGLFDIALVSWIDAATNSNRGSWYVDYYGNDILIRHHLIFSGTSSYWSDYTEMSDGALAVDRIEIHVDLETNLGVITAHDIQVCTV